MAQPPKNITPDVEAKWLALRQQHQEDSNKFQREVTRNRAEFEGRVEKRRKELLDKHINQEREFWSKHGKGSGVNKGATSASKTARTQTPAGARGSTAAPRKSSAPAVRSSSSRPAVPRFELDLHTTPSKASQSVRSPQVPSAPTKSTRRPLQKSGKPEVIDLCSDEDEKEPPKKTPVVQQPVAPNPVQQQAIVQGAGDQEPGTPYQVHNNTSLAIPEATLELFGNSASNCSSTSFAPHIKTEKDQQGHKEPISHLRFPSTPPQRELHGLPREAPVTSFSQRASTATPQFGQTACSRPITPPSTPGHGSWRNYGLNTSSPAFSQRAATTIPDSVQPSASPQQPRNFGFGRDSSPGGFWYRTASAAPFSPHFTFPSHSPSRFAFPLAHVSEPGRLPRSPFSSPGNQQHDHTPFLEQSERGPQSSTPLANTLQMVNGSIANNALQNGREGASERDERNTTDDDVEMADTLNPIDNTSISTSDGGTTTKPTTSARADFSPSTRQHGNLQPSPSAAPAREALNSLQQRWTQQLPSPPPSHASAASEPTTPGSPQASTPTSSFKKPFLPASADLNKSGKYSIGPETRHVRAGTVDSQASSFTLPVESLHQRRASVTSRASSISAHTRVSPNRKRKLAIDLSSDEEDDVSDYAPSEPDSPLANQSTKPLDGPIAKKIKASNGSVVASKVPPRVDNAGRKTNYGFKPAVIPKPRLQTPSSTTTGTARKTPMPTVSTASSRLSTNRPATSAPRQPPNARAPSTYPSPVTPQATPKAASTAKKSQQNKSVPQPSKRRAALAAEDKIHGIFQDTEEFATDCAIEDADHMEDARLPGDMRRMSITPSPGEEAVDMLSSPPANTFASWTKDRMTGDRHTRCQATTADAEDSEPDINYDIKNDKSWRARK